MNKRKVQYIQWQTTTIKEKIHKENYKIKIKKERRNKIIILSLGLGRRKIFFLARLRDRSIFGLRISLFGFGLNLLRLYCNILGL